MESLPNKKQENKEIILETLKNLENFDFLPNQNKVDLICVYQKIKPASKIEIFFKPGYQSYTEGDFKHNLSSLKTVLDDLGLPYNVHVDDFDKEEVAAIFYVGKDQHSLHETMKAFQDSTKDRDKVIGKSLGYPETAIQAYSERKLKKISALPEEIRKSEYIKFLNFQLSEDHWQDEVEDVKKRAKLIKEVDETFYRKIINSQKV
ncbi:MAG: hypothetical protein UT05_C0001G0025 [Parcubacteria group bacterium GW2011_GWF2_38_76]|nr:MAG: hypothetical protein UT05_C0001G0025 [Parcubacteria group bacterium GW2011_GWF2_38_76]HBM45998.1 hypothetical protein [Patescibacteria group bacterium]